MYLNKLKRNFFKSLWQANYNVYLFVPYEIHVFYFYSTCKWCATFSGKWLQSL